LPDFSHGLVVDDTNLYLATNTNIVRVPRAGGAAQTLATFSDTSLIAGDSAHVYFVAEHASGAGSNPPGKTQSTTALYALSLESGTPQVLVDDWYSTAIASDGTSVWAAKVGGVETIDVATAARKTVALEPGATIEALAIGSDGAYLAVYALHADGSGVGSIRRAPKDGSAVQTIVPNLGHPTSIALDEDAVYFNDVGSGFTPNASISRASLDGSGQTKIANVITTVSGAIAVDAHDVYFATADAIQKVAKTGGTPQAVASGLKTPGFVAVRGGNVYWVNATIVAGSDPNPGYAVMTACK
jgi:hypothetical protein